MIDNRSFGSRSWSDERFVSDPPAVIEGCLTVRGIRERIVEDTRRPTGEALGNDRSGPGRHPEAQSNATSLPHSRCQSAAACWAMTNVSRRPWRTRGWPPAAPARATGADSSRWPAAPSTARRAAPRRPAGSTGAASRCAPAPQIPAAGCQLPGGSPGSGSSTSRPTGSGWTTAATGSWVCRSAAVPWRAPAKNVVAARMKQSGMMWGMPGATGATPFCG